MLGASDVKKIIQLYLVQNPISINSSDITNAVNAYLTAHPPSGDSSGEIDGGAPDSTYILITDGGNV